MAVTAANNAKAQTSATAKSALEAEFSNTAAAFTAAGNDFATNTFATTCVTNIRAALEKNIVTREYMSYSKKFKKIQYIIITSGFYTL